MSEGEERKCIGCRKSFDETEFPVSKGGRNSGQRGKRCETCAGERAAWAREWYGRNREQAKEINRRYRESLTGEQKAQQAGKRAAWKQANPDKVREWRRKYAEKSGETDIPRVKRTKEQQREHRKRYVERLASGHVTRAGMTFEKYQERHREASRRYAAAKRAKRVAAGLAHIPYGPCSFCGNPNHYAKGLCRSCYARRLNRGTPEYRVKPGETLEEKFRRRYQVDEATGCWVWHLEVSEDKPPYFSGRNARAVAYESVNGPQAKYLRISMTCGNDRCVNPAHMTAKLRPAEAEKVSLLAAALADVAAGREKKRDIARRLYAAGLVYQEIADAFGVSRQCIEQQVHFKPERRKRRELAHRAYLIARLRMAGAVLKEIAEALQLKEATVKHAITRHRIRSDGSYVPPMEGVDPASFDVPDAVLALEAELRERPQVEKPPRVEKPRRPSRVERLEAKIEALKNQLAALQVAAERGKP